VTLLFWVGCAGMNNMTPEPVSEKVSRIRYELPHRINSNTTLERASYNRAKSAMVCHYRVKIWDGTNALTRKKSKHLFCEMIDERHRDHLFKMAETIELEYWPADGWMKYAFVADKNTCTE
jgi:hypothetical protein